MRAPGDFLFSLEHIGIKLGLDQIRGLVDALGRPDDAYRSIIVAGTNGKGSVTAMLERGLRAAGYRTGRYTSPHLVRLEERFAIDGVDVDSRTMDDAIERVRAAAMTLPVPPTSFEATTAVALDLFRSAAVDVAVVEVGLGGRLDATNVVSPFAAAITAVDFDHQQYLGTTIEAIAREKAGVIKPGMLCVLGANPVAVDTVVAQRCREVGATLVRAHENAEVHAEMDDGRLRMSIRTPRRTYEPLWLGLRGRHQIDNAVTAVRLLEELEKHLDVPPAAIATAVEHVTWPGRLERLHVHGVEVLLDGAHNAQGARALAAYLREVYARRLPMVIGVLRDKDVEIMMTTLVQQASQVVCVAPRSDRALPATELAALVARVAPDIAVTTSGSAIAAVRAAAVHGWPVVVAGSLYLAGEVRAEIS